MKENSKIANLGNLERWFASRMEPGNRNNMLFKYAMILVDNGLSLREVEVKLKKFNKQLSDPVTDEELDKSILVSVAKKVKQ